MAKDESGYAQSRFCKRYYTEIEIIILGWFPTQHILYEKSSIILEIGSDSSIQTFWNLKLSALFLFIFSDTNWILSMQKDKILSYWRWKACAFFRPMQTIITKKRKNWGNKRHHFIRKGALKWKLAADAVQQFSPVRADLRSLRLFPCSFFFNMLFLFPRTPFKMHTTLLTALFTPSSQCTCVLAARKIRHREIKRVAIAATLYHHRSWE